MPIAAGLYYTRSEGGESSKKPVVLIHGAGSSHLCWPASLRRMRGRTVLALDLPGHGRSEGIGLQSVEAYSAAVIAFLAELGLYHANFIGHSLGGAIALQLALDFPQHVIGLGVISTGAWFNVDGNLLTQLNNPATYKDGLQGLQKRLFADEADSALVARSMSSLNETRSSVLCGDWKACASFDLRKNAEKINTPVYVTCGQEDQITHPANARMLAESLPMAKLELLAGTGHMVILEQPQLLAKGLMDFLADLDSFSENLRLPLSIQAEKHISARLQDTSKERAE